MKVKENVTDKFGHECILFTNAKTEKIYEYLWNNYGGMGYKFSVVFDVSGEELPDQKELKEAWCYFLGDTLDEVVEYIGDIKVVNKSDAL